MNEGIGLVKRRYIQSWIVSLVESIALAFDIAIAIMRADDAFSIIAYVLIGIALLFGIWMSVYHSLRYSNLLNFLRS